MERELSKLQQLIDRHELRTIEVGALGRLVDACRKNDDRLPTDHATIYRVTFCRDDSERLAVLSMLSLFFEIRDGFCYPKAEA